MRTDFFLIPVSPTEAARVPFPEKLPLAERDAYMTRVPPDALASAERVPHVAAPIAPDAAPVAPLPTDED